MHVYHVSYDLNGPGQDYEALIAEIKQSHDWQSVCDSTWLVATGESAGSLCKRLQSKIDSNDILLITRIHSDSWAGLANKAVGDWLEQYTSPF